MDKKYLLTGKKTKPANKSNAYCHNIKIYVHRIKKYLA